MPDSQPVHAPDDPQGNQELLRRLESETQSALNRIYQLDSPTPLDHVPLECGCRLALKREDLANVHSYKWRGSFNKIASMHEQGFSGTMVAASAGNHAQGVAVAANRLSLEATIFMPRSTPHLKQESVAEFGGKFVEIRLHGDSFDEAAGEAQRFAEKTGGAIIPPYDDMQVIAGQATIGEEIADALDEPPTHVFLEVGGGGMAAGVASVIKRRFPDAHLIVVEAVDQNSMGVSLDNDQRTSIETLDRFCDGTAVACPGELPFQICRQLIDQCVTVTNDQVCEAIQYLWQKKRIIVEPSAALGVAASLQYGLKPTDRPITVLSGSNVDFMMLPKIARRGQVRRPETRYYVFEINEQHGSLAELLDNFFANMNIIDFQYGKVASEIAYPVIGVEVPHSEIDILDKFLVAPNVPPHHDITGSPASEFRVIPFNMDIISLPFFAVIEFANRPGALRDFMRYASKLGSVCYMNYTDTGQTEGQALMGFEFAHIGLQSEFIEWLQATTKFELVPTEVVRHFNSSEDLNSRWQTLKEKSRNG